METPGSFYVVSQLVKDDAELAKVLSSAGEVGSHSVDHKPLAGLTLEDQRVRLRRGRAEVRGWAGTDPKGLRPPEETFDSNTLQAWLDAGGGYILAMNQARSGSPEIYRLGGKELVLLPRLLKDDYNVFVQDGAMRADRLTEAFLGGVQKLRSIGGLAVVGVHTQILGNGKRLEAIRTVIDTAVAQGDWWIAGANEVAKWWRTRASVRVSVTAWEDPTERGESAGASDADQVSRWEEETRLPGPLGTEILVEAPADKGVRGLWVDVSLPEEIDGLTPIVGGFPVSFSSTDFGIRIPVGDLGAGETRKISFRVLESGSGH